MTVTIRGTGKLSLDELASLFTAGFEAYLVPLVQSPAALAVRIRADQIDLHLSRLAVDGERPVGLCLLAVRGRRVRIAAMGIVREERGRGIGRALLDAAVETSIAAGAERLVLEVIDQNAAAVALYESGGFTTRRRLLGHARPPVDPSAAPEHRLADLDELVRALSEEPDRAWPWQIASASIGSLPPAFEVHALGADAYACVHPTPLKLALRQLVVRPSARRRGLARRLLASIQARHPQASWDIPPFVPEELAPEALAALGFVPGSLHQLEMERPLP